MEPDDRGAVTIGGEDDDPGPPDYSSANRDCCPPQLFTSVLLGLLACVLVTGGVFLAFHRWDHTWLLVSAVGVLLMAIGTALHCCSSSQNERKGHRCKGGCGINRSKPEAVNSGNGTLLTEQLLPLSNARSVSQLSLNMVPGYFPPLVYPSGPPYGLEQHSAVVQNISKLVQHQQQLHLQSPSATQPDAKSFILLPLPVDTNASNIKNIVAAVCQLENNTSDANNDGQTTDASSQATETSVMSRENSSTIVPTTPGDTSQPSTSSQPVLKHAEVQTCSDWNQLASNELKSSSDASTATTSVATEVLSTAESSTSDCTSEAVESELQRTINSDLSSVEQTVLPLEGGVNQADSFGDNSCDNIITPELSDIPNTAVSQNDIPMDSTHQTATSIVTLDESNGEPAENTTVLEHSLNESVSSHEFNDVNETTNMSTNGSSAVSVIPDVTGSSANLEMPSSISGPESMQSSIPLNVPPTETIDSSLENIGDTSSDLEAELFDRSSPPPSYDDVTQEASTSGPLNGFGLAYGTM